MSGWQKQWFCSNDSIARGEAFMKGKGDEHLIHSSFLSNFISAIDNVDYQTVNLNLGSLAGLEVTYKVITIPTLNME